MDPEKNGLHQKLSPPRYSLIDVNAAINLGTPPVVPPFVPALASGFASGNRPFWAFTGRSLHCGVRCSINKSDLLPFKCDWQCTHCFASGLLNIQDFVFFASFPR